LDGEVEEEHYSYEGKIKYKPVSVRELLTEIQNITGFMVDLAYSSILFHDRDIAEEVLEFEERVRTLTTLLVMNTAIVVRDGEDAEASVGIMRVASAANKIADTAGEIARIVLSGLGIDRSIIEAFNNVDERLVRTKILSKSILARKTLSELQLATNIGVDILTIRRGKKLIVDPHGDARLEEDDLLIGRGSDVGTAELDKLAKGELKKIPNPAY
jgi:uncharacterized protein with PhoU and TrkA domain